MVHFTIGSKRVFKITVNFVSVPNIQLTIVLFIYTPHSQFHGCSQPLIWTLCYTSWSVMWVLLTLTWKLSFFICTLQSRFRECFWLESRISLFIHITIGSVSVLKLSCKFSFIYTLHGRFRECLRLALNSRILFTCFTVGFVSFFKNLWYHCSINISFSNNQISLNEASLKPPWPKPSLGKMLKVGKSIWITYKL